MDSGELRTNPDFIKNHKFDYHFFTYWERIPPKSIMRPFVRLEDPIDPEIKKRQIDGTKKRCKCKSKKK